MLLSRNHHQQSLFNLIITLLITRVIMSKHNNKTKKTNKNSRKKDQESAKNVKKDSVESMTAEQTSTPKTITTNEQYLTPNPLSQFSLDKDALRTALITAQLALRATRQPNPLKPVTPTGLLVLVNGMEQAGKGTAVTQLRQWVDPRLLKVEATIGYPCLTQQPIWQAHINAMPRHGDVMVYFGNWYADLLYNVMRMVKEEGGNKADKKGAKKSTTESDKNVPIEKWQSYLQQQLRTLQAFEHDLAMNHTKILKCWFHVDADTLQARLNDDEVDPEFLYQIDWNDAQTLAEFNKVAATLLSQQGDWVIIDGSNKSQAATQFCHTVLQAMQSALASSHQSTTSPEPSLNVVNNAIINTDSDSVMTACLAHESALFLPVDIPDVLTTIPNTEMDKSVYEEQLAAKQTKLAELLRARGNRHVVFAFEGMDAAGKGGAIKRLVAPLDPREYQIYNIGAPMQFELEHPYLWRFWTRLPNEHTERLSRIAIFDRTWYGRVLVERIEAFATDTEWQRAYAEINRFEKDLADADVIVLKYWLAIDKNEQLQRFEKRKTTEYKQFKLTDDDWRNREEWAQYVQAAADMLARTDTAYAPWCIVANNDKHQARLQVLDHAITQLQLQL